MSNLANAAIGLMMGLVVVGAGLWVGYHVIVAMDKMYMPVYDQVMNLDEHRNTYLNDDDDCDHLNDQCPSPLPPSPPRPTQPTIRDEIDEEYYRKVDEEISRLQGQNGLWRPGGGGKYKARIKAKFVARMDRLTEQYRKAKLRKETLNRDAQCKYSSNSDVTTMLQLIHPSWCPATSDPER